MANRLSGKVSLDDEHKQVHHLIEHGGVKIAGAKREEKLANDVCEAAADQSWRTKGRIELHSRIFDSRRRLNSACSLRCTSSRSRSK